MGAPTRFTSGITQDAKWQPLGRIGSPDPFFYSMYSDDFLPYVAGNYTVTAAGGSVATTAVGGNGGRILFTTGATATNFAEIQMPSASIANTAGYKLAYLARIQLADITNSQLVMGLIQTTATPTTVTNGIYFTKANASTSLVLNVVSGSASQATVTITQPTSGLAINADIDIGFVVDTNGDVLAFVGNQLVGAKPRITSSVVVGPTAKIAGSSIAALPTGLMNPTLTLIAGTNVAQTMYADFQYAAMER